MEAIIKGLQVYQIRLTSPQMAGKRLNNPNRSLGGRSMQFTTATGVVLKAGMLGELIRKVHEHETANGLNLTSPDDIETKVCEEAERDGIKRCRTEGDTEIITAKGFPLNRESLTRILKAIKRSVKVNMDAARNGVTMLAGWLKNGQFATKEEADRRALICAECPKNVDVSCSSCAAGAFLLKQMNVVGGRTTSSDVVLKHCEACGCSNKIKVWVPKSVILEKTPKEQMDNLPASCWIAIEAKQ